MMLEVLIPVLIALNCFAWIVIAWILLAKYRSVRDSGLLWLAGALVLWPLISNLARYGERILMDRLVAGESVGIYPFSLVAQGTLTLGSLSAILSYSHHLVGAVLILIAVAHLYRNRSTESGKGGC
jgi:hypothetical protein